MELNQDLLKDRRDRWEAIRKEYDAKRDAISAERRMEANDAFNNFSEEADAGGDWAEAKWDEFLAKVEKWWNELEITGHEKASESGINTD